MSNYRDQLAELEAQIAELEAKVRARESERHWVIFRPQFAKHFDDPDGLKEAIFQYLTKAP